MTDPRPFGRRAADRGSIPRGEVLASVETHAEAQAIVDRLAAADFEIDRISIVGRDITMVERVTGRTTYPRAAGRGALSGAVYGLLLGLVLTFIDPETVLPFVAAAVLVGAGFGMLSGLASHALGRRQQTFRSTHQVFAASYEIIVPPELLLRAQGALAQHSSTDG